MKAYFNMANPPVKIVKVVMGNAAIGSLAETQELPIVRDKAIVSKHLY